MIIVGLIIDMQVVFSKLNLSPWSFICLVHVGNVVLRRNYYFLNASFGLYQVF